MQSNLKVVNEVEIPDANPIEVKTVQPSAKSSAASLHMVELLGEIRRVLNARAGALMAMLGALGLTAAAMVQGTTMALLIALSYDIAVFLPIALIAYRMPKS
jgi:2-methylaconitate cis-trans-isomerase PrpF